MIIAFAEHLREAHKSAQFSDVKQHATGSLGSCEHSTAEN
jgi:hypothetical protein